MASYRYVWHGAVPLFLLCLKIKRLNHVKTNLELHYYLGNQNTLKRGWKPRGGGTASGLVWVVIDKNEPHISMDSVRLSHCHQTVPNPYISALPTCKIKSTWRTVSSSAHERDKRFFIENKFFRKRLFSHLGFKKRHPSFTAVRADSHGGKRHMGDRYGRRVASMEQTWGICDMGCLQLDTGQSCRGDWRLTWGYTVE